MKKNNYGRIVNMSSGLGQLNEMGGGFTAYRMSKTAVNVITRVLAAELSGTNILVNSMCPGWVAKTHMGGPGATRSVEEGADTAVWLTTLPDGGPTGKIFAGPARNCLVKGYLPKGSQCLKDQSMPYAFLSAVF